MSDLKITLFPELDELRRMASDQDFISKCAQHAISLGYSSKYENDRVCIFKDGESSCHPGTLVGWRYVNDLENYIMKEFPDLNSKRGRREEDSKIFSAVGEISYLVSKLLRSEV